VHKPQVSLVSPNIGLEESSFIKYSQEVAPDPFFLENSFENHSLKRKRYENG
jgi:hypothetical protein